jgi:hypothetical protein
MRPRLKGLHVDIRLFVEHYGGGSWKPDNLKAQAEWLKKNEALWKTPSLPPRGEEKRTAPDSSEKKSKPATKKRTKSKSK